MKFSASVLLIILIAMSAAGQSAADLILVNANIRTLNAKKPQAEAIAVANGKIIAVGTNNEVRRFADEKTRVIDAGGRLAIPGFNDAHVHFTGIGNQFSHLNARHVRTAAELIERIGHFASILPKGRWMMGGSLAADVPRPTLAQLDAASPDNPLLIYLADPSKALVNSAAIRLSRITSENGFIQGATVTVVRNTVPMDYERNWAEIAETASNYAASLGVTSVQDVHSDDLVAVLRELHRHGRLKTRIYDCIGIDKWRDLEAKGTKAASGDAMIRDGCVKGVAYGEDDEVDDLKKTVTAADKAGIQVKIHAIGRSANQTAIDAYEYSAKANGLRDRRFVIEHATRFVPEIARRFEREKIVASMQPHLFFFPGSKWGEDFRSLSNASVPLAFGSDASITDFNPLLGIYAAVHPGNERSMSVEAAVRAYTLGSAYSEFQENVKGTLEVGKLADMVVLSNNIFEIGVEKIRETKVIFTIVDGKVVYDSSNLKRGH